MKRCLACVMFALLVFVAPAFPAGAAGFAADNAAYKAAPQNYAGSVSDAAEVVRVAITGSPNSPDLCTIMGILGRERSLARLSEAAARL